jgi:hypothetical protein
MAQLIRKCTNCGALDPTMKYKSPDDAARQGAFNAWTCSSCAWTEFDLVDADEAQRDQETAGMRSR